MGRPAIFLAISVMAILCVPAAARASVKSFNELSSEQILALQDSEQRMLIYDRALTVLDQEKKAHRIGAKAYQYREHDLVGYIAEEASFQNAILIKEKTASSIDLGEIAQKAAGPMEEAAMVIFRAGCAYVAEMK